MSQHIAGKTKLGYDEYACFPDDGNRHEVIDGAHRMTPAPSTNHQSISMRLAFALYDLVGRQGLGTVFSAPIDVQLTEHDIVQPDLVVAVKSREQMITPTKIKGAPRSGR